MPPKTYKCMICGEEVSKRKSLFMGSLNGGEGRACRKHQEVIDLLKNHQEEMEIKETIEKAGRIMRVISGAAFVRMCHTLYGVRPEFIYWRFRGAGYPEDLIQDIKTEVDRQGGSQMTNDEIQEAAVMAVVMREKGMV